MSVEHDEEHRERPVLEFRGLHVDMPVLRLFAAFWISVIVALGCVGIVLAPTDRPTTEAAIAILSALITGWISYMARQ